MVSDLRVGMYSDTILPRPDGIAVSLEAAGIALGQLGLQVEVVGPRMDESYNGSLPVRNVSSFRPWGRDYNVGLVLPWLPSKGTSATNYDLVHVHTLGPVGLAGLAAARRAGIPAVMTWHTDLLAYQKYYPEIRYGAALATITLWLLGTRRMDSRVGTRYERLARQLLSAFDAIIAPTLKIQEHILGLGCRPPTAVLPSPTLPLPAPQISVAALRGHLGIPPPAPVVLSVGRLSPEKNPELLLRGFALLLQRRPDARLVMVGPPRGSQQLLRLASDLGVAASVHMTGVVGRRLLGAYYYLASVVVVASLTDTQSLVAQEAAAFGVPVVIADERLANRCVQSHFLAKPCPGDLAHTVEQSMANVPYPPTSRYPDPGRYVPERNIHARRLIEVYESVLRNRKMISQSPGTTQSIR